MAAVAMWPAVLQSACAQTLDENKAMKVKAAFLYNFARFVRWPENVLGDDSEPFVIGVLGSDPFGRILDDTVKGKKVAGHAVRVRRFDWNNNADRAAMAHCHVLFISTSEQHRLNSILAVLEGRPVLAVSDMGDFARRGGMIGFVLEKRRIAFEINREVLEHAHLKASAKLLKLAKIVRSEGKP